VTRFETLNHILEQPGRAAQELSGAGEIPGPQLDRTPGRQDLRDRVLMHCQHRPRDLGKQPLGRDRRVGEGIEAAPRDRHARADRAGRETAENVPVFRKAAENLLRGREGGLGRLAG